MSLNSELNLPGTLYLGDLHQTHRSLLEIAVWRQNSWSWQECANVTVSIRFPSNFISVHALTGRKDQAPPPPRPVFVNLHKEQLRRAFLTGKDWHTLSAKVSFSNVPFTEDLKICTTCGGVGKNPSDRWNCGCCVVHEVCTYSSYLIDTMVEGLDNQPSWESIDNVATLPVLTNTQIYPLLIYTQEVGGGKKSNWMNEVTNCNKSRPGMTTQ